MTVIRHPEGGAGRVFWLSNERPNGPITFWRGNGGVDWEVEYVPAADLRGAVEAARKVLRDHEITDLEDGGVVYVDALALAELRDVVRSVRGQ
jgi:hypothetical protein